MPFQILPLLKKSKFISNHEIIFDMKDMLQKLSEKNFTHIFSKIGLSKTLLDCGVATPAFAAANDFIEAKKVTISCMESAEDKKRYFIEKESEKTCCYCIVLRNSQNKLSLPSFRNSSKNSVIQSFRNS